MSSDQVRPIIECFCQILSSHGFTSITSETFRLAKFDRNEATIPLWRLIYEMIHLESNTIPSEFSKETFDPTPKDQIVDFIKNYLSKRGYTYEYFLALDNQMQKGSRQLLVCLGWLIYHVKLMEKCMKQCLTSMSTVDQACLEDKHSNGSNDLIKQIEQAVHANDKIRSRLRAIEQGSPIDVSHLSTFEDQLRQTPYLVSQYLSELDNEHNQLNLFLFWNTNEDIFWKWMESVLDQPAVVLESDSECQRLEAEKQKFNAAVDTLDSALIRLEQLWLSNDNHALIERDVSSIITSIDTQISSLFNQLLNNKSVVTIESPLE